MKLTVESNIIPHFHLPSSTLFDEEYRNLSQRGLVLFDRLEVEASFKHLDLLTRLLIPCMQDFHDGY